jgi:hypothetical protein
VPKLAAAIGESQNYKQDVLPVLQSYSQFCSKKFQHELKITFAGVCLFPLFQIALRVKLLKIKYIIMKVIYTDVNNNQTDYK